MLVVGIAQNPGPIARRGLIGEELDFENWPAMAIYVALPLNHLVFHAHIRDLGATSLIFLRRCQRPPHISGHCCQPRRWATRLSVTSAEGYGRFTSFSLGAGERILLEVRINHKLAVRGVNIPAKVGQPLLIFVSDAIVAIVAFTDPSR